MRQPSLSNAVKALLENSPDRVSEAMQQEALDAEKGLRDGGVDIEMLLAKREEIKQLREKRAYAVVKELDGQQVRMPGFALPLAFDNRKITETCSCHGSAPASTPRRRRQTRSSMSYSTKTTLL